KLHTLQSDSTKVNTLFELCAHVTSINSEEKVIIIGFENFEEIWKFCTYYRVGFVGHCLEHLLLDDQLWLESFEEDIAIDVSIPEETLNRVYTGLLMQEGMKRYLVSTATVKECNKNIPSSRSGDLAQFEPPFLDSGWTVHKSWYFLLILFLICLRTVWFFFLTYHAFLLALPAHGTCLATVEYDAEGPFELSLAQGNLIVIVGHMISGFDWFIGRKEMTGEVGLVKTSHVKPTTDSCFLNVFSFAGTTSHKADTQRIEGLREKMQTILKQPKSCLSDITSADISLKDSVMLTEPETIPPCFTVHPILEENNSNSKILAPLLSFLDGADCKVEFGLLYQLNPEVLTSSIFCGHSCEDELISFLSVGREMARRKKILWSQTRLCFLLGKICAGRSKFSQARVYFEETLRVPQECFRDFKLLASTYYNLATVYLLQKNMESFSALMERLVALIMGIPTCLECLKDTLVLQYFLKKAVFYNNKTAEARACCLLAKHHWTCAEKVVPYLERLLVLGAESELPWNVSLSQGYLTLAHFYQELGLLHLSTSSARKASQQPTTALSDCLDSMILVLENVDKLHGTIQQAFIPSQALPFLYKALSFALTEQEGGSNNHVLSHQLAFCLSKQFYKHRMFDRAIDHMNVLCRDGLPLYQIPVSETESNNVLLWMAWLHIDNNQPSLALDILDLVLSSIPEHCTTPQEGVILNLQGVALCNLGYLRKAAESYQAAVDICQEYEDLANWAVAQGNLGLLSLKAGAKKLAERHLTEAVQLFSELEGEGHEANFIGVLLELGRHFVKQREIHHGKGCYEWALLLAVKANLFDCQLSATRILCHLYKYDCPDQTRCIIYNEYQIHLLRHLKDQIQESEVLEILSEIYLNLGTERAYRAALDCTKSSLGIFIDLGLKKKEAYGWLHAGKIYHLLGHNELVDLYVQVAQEVALKIGDTSFILKFLETAGDIFLNSCRDRDKAITFYRERALPMAIKQSSSVHTTLRLCNKLTVVMFSLNLYKEALEFAQMALDLSISQGEHLNQRVAYHRLASLYHRLEQYELAEHYYLKTLTHCPTPMQFDEETLYYVRVYQVLGDMIFYDMKDPFDAAGYYHLALAAAMDLGNKHAQLQLCTRLATIYHNFLNDRDLSLFFYQKARAFAAELHVRRTDISLFKQYSSTSVCTIKEEQK
uniref:SH3 domain and tetratricopeptide repeats 1 n=1 Tax=Cynoglossus semilaevis TaxID=244447 RepID=A0A3P8W6L7_CYNSE